MILVIVVFGLMQLAANMGSTMMLLTPALRFVAAVIFFAILMGKTSKESIEGGPAKTRQTLTKIRETDKYFSVETFIGNLSNKLISICYAESAEEIRPFVQCNMTSFMAKYRCVIDCKMLECVLMDYRAEGDFQHLKVKVGLELVTYRNGEAHKEKTYLQLGLIKSIRALTQSINDVNVYRCGSCGASLSLLNGGRCDYCGKGLDLKEYDWVIESCEN